MSGLAITIKPMTRAHIPACDDIVRFSEPWRTLRERIDFDRFIDEKEAFVALVEGAVAGFVIFTPEPVFARGGYLRAVAVAPAIRGFGLGKRLLRFAEETTAKKARNLFLCVSSFNAAAQKFYRQVGYTKAGRLDDLIKKGLSEYIYWKRLK